MMRVSDHLVAIFVIAACAMPVGVAAVFGSEIEMPCRTDPGWIGGLDCVRNLCDMANLVIGIKDIQ